MKDGLVIVHASDHIIHSLNGSEILVKNIVERVRLYISHGKPVFYTPFIANEGVPEYLKHLSSKVNLILLHRGYPHPIERDFVSKQASKLGEELTKRRIKVVEVGGLYRNACVRHTSTKLMEQGFETTVNPTLCNTSDMMKKSS